MLLKLLCYFTGKLLDWDFPQGVGLNQSPNPISHFSFTESTMNDPSIVLSWSNPFLGALNYVEPPFLSALRLDRCLKISIWWLVPIRSKGRLRCAYVASLPQVSDWLCKWIPVGSQLSYLSMWTTGSVWNRFLQAHFSRCPAPTARNYWIWFELVNWLTTDIADLDKTLSMGTILAYKGISSFLNTPQGAFFAYPVGVIGSLFHSAGNTFWYYAFIPYGWSVELRPYLLKY